MIGFPATCRNQCLECRVLDMWSMYERERLTKLAKKELQDEHKKLLRKIRKLDAYELCDDDINETDDQSQDENYVAETPQKQCKHSLTQQITNKRQHRSVKEREKKEKIKVVVMTVKKSQNFFKQKRKKRASPTRK